MAELNPPCFIAAGGEQADNARRMLDALAGGPGIMSPGDLEVTQNATPNMSVNVTAGRVWMLGTEAARQGLYFGENDATVDKPIAPADPVNPRKDLIVARVKDAQYSGGDNLWEIAVVTGTPAGAPSEPAAPDNAEVLALVDVPAGDDAVGDAQITDRRRLWLRAAAPLGYLTRAISTSNSSSTSGTTELTTLTTSPVTPPVAGRVWKVTMWARGVDGTNTDDLYVLRIYDGGALVADGHVRIDNLTQCAFPTVTAVIPDVPVTPHAFSARIIRAGGSGTAQITATAASPRFLLVEDIGAIPL